MSFDMPKTGTWEQRAGWVVNRLSIDLSWPKTSGAALCGNFGVESMEFKAFQEIGPKSGRGGAGWGQWTGVRRRNFEKWAAVKGFDLGSQPDEASYGFTVFEFLGADSTMERGSDFRSLSAKLRGPISIEDATHLIHEWYERPQEALDGTFKSGPKRLAYARRALEGAKALAHEAVAGQFADPAPSPHKSQPVLRLTNPPTIRPEVLNLQTLLIIKGFDPGSADSTFGSRTEVAVKSFQREKGLTPDGVVGPKTWTELESLK